MLFSGDELLVNLVALANASTEALSHREHFGPLPDDAISQVVHLEISSDCFADIVILHYEKKVSNLTKVLLSYALGCAHLWGFYAGRLCRDRDLSVALGLRYVQTYPTRQLYGVRPVGLPERRCVGNPVVLASSH